MRSKSVQNADGAKRAEGVQLGLLGNIDVDHTQSNHTQSPRYSTETETGGTCGNSNSKNRNKVRTIWIHTRFYTPLHKGKVLAATTVLNVRTRDYRVRHLVHDI